MDRVVEHNNLAGKIIKEFDATDFIMGKLCITDVKHWTDETGYRYRIIVENKDGEDVAFVMNSDRLCNYKKALRAFSIHIGRKLRLPKGMEREAWDKVVKMLTAWSEEVFSRHIEKQVKKKVKKLKDMEEEAWLISIPQLKSENLQEANSWIEGLI